MFLGSQVTLLVFVEVTPATKESLSISNAIVKKHLIAQGVFNIHQCDKDPTTPSHSQAHRVTIGLLSFPSLNPLSIELCPCLVVGYGFPVDTSPSQYAVTDSTLVRILPSRLLGPEQFERLGELPTPTLEACLREELRQNQQSTQTLKLRMVNLLSIPLAIGTTFDAIDNGKLRRKRSLIMQEQIKIYSGRQTIVYTPVRKPRHEGALTVHSANHGAGKTILVRSIAEELGCSVHVIEAAPLLAKYGTYADAALETLVHSVIVSAAVKGERLCILLDHLSAFGPMSKIGDASLPILISMSSYLSTLTKSIQQKQEVPFPTKNPLYNLSGTNGRILKAFVCIVGVVTCPDGDLIKGGSQDVLSMLQGGRYRLPDLTTEGRIQALSAQLVGVPLSEEAVQRLPSLVASRVGLFGRDFSRIKRRLMQLGKSDITVEDLADALSTVQQTKPAQYEVVIHADKSTNEGDLFSSVGGNTEAKMALQDALAMDPHKRRILSTFGMSPPAGVLLYGPPGTGKTLLAKAVAKLLANAQTGGAFFSLQASEIVRSEVGNSEKELVTAFATARANAPSVIFIDEFQALFTERSVGSGGQLASTLLHCMDDINRWKDSDEVSGSEPARIVVMGATNTPWMIDTAFLRPGRFDKVVHVGLPSQDERKSILRVHMLRMRLKEKAHLFDALCDEVARQTEGFSGADLAALCRSAAVRCLREQGDDGVVDGSHFLEALKNDISATSSEELVVKLARWKP
jgi:ATP-dependent 26S proteasome regulatory subunit